MVLQLIGKVRHIITPGMVQGPHILRQLLMHAGMLQQNGEVSGCDR